MRVRQRPASASTILRRRARSAGSSPTAMLMSTMAAIPISHTDTSSRSANCPPVPFSTIAPSVVASSSPSRPPNRHRATASASTKPSTLPGEAQGLEHGQLGHPLAYALRHGVADHQQQREEHREQDPAHDQADVADLLDEPQVEILLGLGLGLVRGVLEHRIDRPADRLGPITVGELEYEEIGATLAELVGLIEVVVVDEGDVGALLPVLVLAIEYADQIESPGLAAVLLRIDVGRDRDLLANLPAVLVGELPAGDHGGAGMGELLP